MPRLNPFAWGRTSLTKVWDARIDGHVASLAWSAQRGLIAAASVDGPIAVLDEATGQVRHNLAGHGFGTACVAWSADGQHLASAGQDGKARLWSLLPGGQDLALAGGAAWVERALWSPIANILATSAGKKLRLWNPAGEMIREYPDHPSTIADIAWSPPSPRPLGEGLGVRDIQQVAPRPSGEGLGVRDVLASAAYGKLFLWSPDQQQPVQEFAWQGSMLAVAWSPDGKYIAAGAQDSSVHFWLLATGEDLQMSGYPTKVRELSWSADGRYLATGGGTIPCVWDFSGKGPEGTHPLQFEAHKENVSCLAFQRRGPFLASAGEDGLLALWHPGKQQGALALARHDSPVSQLLWSEDDQRLAIGTGAGEVIAYALK